MKFVLSLDYELFFGTRTGSPENCMIEPTRRVAEVLERNGCLLTLFVDAAYLCRLRNSRHRGHGEQYEQIARQLRLMAKRGHDIQLHVHTHWEDSVWQNECWIMDTRRYRLHDFTPSEQVNLVGRYVETLTDASGVAPVAYRAGGWCLQPFDKIAAALTAAGVCIDSTVYANGRSTNSGREFDFRNAPDRDWWRFEDDPLKPVDNGRFLEIPISSFSLSPTHYWRMLLTRINPRTNGRNIGDGVPLANSRAYYLRKLFLPETAVASVDGGRADYLESSWRDHVQRQSGLFNVMGHPKSMTDQSLVLLDRFLRVHRNSLEPVRLRDLAHADHPEQRTG